MKKIVLVCGLIGGAIVSLTMATSAYACYRTGNFESSMLLGYASMLLAFSLIFVGIKTYRDKYNGGVVSFGKAFKIGLYISLICSTVYVIAWMIEYYFFVPDFMEKYTAYVTAKAQASGNAAEALKQKERMQSMMQLYKNPVFMILLTYLEILPIGVIVSLICARLLRRKQTPKTLYQEAA